MSPFGFKGQRTQIRKYGGAISQQISTQRLRAVRRFLAGLIFGFLLTGEAFLIGGTGHGSYAPLAFAASITVLVPFLALAAGPLLWSTYFFLIPKLRSRKASLAVWVVLLLHLGPGLWVAYDDPAFAQTEPWLLVLFAISFLAAVAFLLFFAGRGSRR